ncbi:hypothetical protein ACFFGT_26415 [Mucilaginibacter angelicae]|uniref:Peptidase C39-like domain-containing protein n=1 Tax=Mucilaginibacter angelicae TaxID=869718 RepID=A0ABV6LE90_9SPHI
MPKTSSINDGLNYRKIGKPCIINNLNQPFVQLPVRSLTDLRIKMGPFKASTDAFVFANSFQMTVENAAQIRERLQGAWSSVFDSVLKPFKDALNDLSVDLDPVNIGPLDLGPSITVGLPEAAIDFVLKEIAGKLVFDNIVGSAGTFGRCGGMAFAGYDFYLSNWQINSSIKTPPSTGVLGDYIFNRLLDSIGMNAMAWLDWSVTLHVLPIASVAGNVALGLAVGSLEGPIGAAFGGLLGSQIGIFDFGGKKVILDRTKDEWGKIKNRLDNEAACPIGLLFSDSVSPLGDHQVLAIGYEDDGVAPTLTVWDNRDGNTTRLYKLNFGGDELNVDQIPFNDDGGIKGFFLEDYAHIQPPIELKI